MKYRLMIVATYFAAQVCFAQRTPPMTQEDHNRDFALFDGVATNLVLSLEAGMKADEAMARMTSEGKDRIRTAFIAAKVSWLQNRNEQAIQILEKLIDEHGKDESGLEFGSKVSIAGSYWLATIARAQGDLVGAASAYDVVVKESTKNDSLVGPLVYCYLQKAEFEAVALKRKDLALETLGKIKKMPSPFGQGQEKEWNVFQEWTDYQIAALNERGAQAQKSLSGSPLKSMLFKIIVNAELSVAGITAKPRIDFYDGTRIVMRFCALRQVAELEDAPLLSTFAQAELGRMHELQGEYPVAENYYRNVLDGGSFFAPEGGLLLAKCQLKQGKTEASKNTCMEVKRRFAGYSALVSDLEKAK